MDILTNLPTISKVSLLTTFILISVGAVLSCIAQTLSCWKPATVLCDLLIFVSLSIYCISIFSSRDAASASSLYFFTFTLALFCGGAFGGVLIIVIIVIGGIRLLKTKLRKLFKT